MKLPAFQTTNMLVPTPGERLTAHPAVVFVLFIPVLLTTQLGRSAVYGLLSPLLPRGTPTAVYLLIQLFATAVTIAAVLLYCLLAERRRPVTLGFTWRGAFSEYGIGLGLGFIMFGGAVLLCWTAGVLTVCVADATPSLGLLLLFFLGFLIQGMSEEMLCRSYLMVSLSRSLPLWACAMLNALLFSVLHMGNPGVTVIALVNIFLFGVFASVLTLRRGSIWMVGALHSMWNFAQGNFFGIPVSGITGSPSPLVSIPETGTWKELINGGAFGLEAGLGATAILVLSCVIVLLLPTKKSEISKEYVA